MTGKKLNLSALIHAADFDFQVEELGTIRCGPFRTTDSDRLKEMIDAGAGSVDVAKALFASIARRLTGDKKVDAVAGGPLLNDDELGSITLDDLNRFCETFVKRSLWIRTEGEQHPAALEQQPGETGCDFLVRAFRVYRDGQKSALKQFTDHLDNQFKPGFFTKHTLDTMRENFEKSASLGTAISALKTPQMEVREFPSVRMPGNPMIETNRKLEKLLAHNESMRQLATQCAAMIQSMNDTATGMQRDFMANAVHAERQAKRATWFAVGGLLISIVALVISSIFSWLTLLDAREGGKQNDKMVQSIQNEIRSLGERLQQQQAENRAAFLAAVDKASHVDR